MNYTDDQFEKIANHTIYKSSIVIKSGLNKTNHLAVTNAQLAQIKIILKNESVNLPGISTLLHQVQNLLNSNNVTLVSDPVAYAQFNKVQTSITKALHSLQHLG